MPQQTFAIVNTTFYASYLKQPGPILTLGVMAELTESESPLESIRDDAVSLAQALDFVVATYVRQFPVSIDTLPDDQRKAFANAAFIAGRALGRHSRLKRLYKMYSERH